MRSISIHALRVEGDRVYETVTTDREISIHALRVEGDVQNITPPLWSRIFLSTPSGWRATAMIKPLFPSDQDISIHALRVEGDTQIATFHLDRLISIHALRVEGDYILFVLLLQHFFHFYPRPPGGGRQQKRTKFSSVFAQKGEEFASLRREKRKICRWRFKKDKFWVLIWCEGSGKSVCALASHCG